MRCSIYNSALTDTKLRTHKLRRIHAPKGNHHQKKTKGRQSLVWRRTHTRAYHSPRWQDFEIALPRLIHTKNHTLNKFTKSALCHRLNVHLLPTAAGHTLKHTLHRITKSPLSATESLSNCFQKTLETPIHIIISNSNKPAQSHSASLSSKSVPAFVDRHYLMWVTRV